MLPGKKGDAVVNRTGDSGIELLLGRRTSEDFYVVISMFNRKWHWQEVDDTAVGDEITIKYKFVGDVWSIGIFIVFYEFDPLYTGCSLEAPTLAVLISLFLAALQS